MSSLEETAPSKAVKAKSTKTSKASKSEASAPKAYAQAGVDIALAERSLEKVKPMLREATRPEVLGGIGGFGGLFDISRTRLKQPVLVSSTDGVGTKLKVAHMSGLHEGVGTDIVNHCLNDIAVCGAEPLYFLDYYGTGKLDPKIYATVLGSIAKACKEANCALIGGETAEMPGLYSGSEFDLVGTIVGVVDRRKILTGGGVRPGDQLIGLASSGLHTNGFSLARKILFDNLGHKPGDKLPGTRTTVAKALLAPHTNYSNVLLGALKKFNKGADYSKRAGNGVLAAAHITGGGFTGNIPRILPDNVDAVVDTTAWELPPLFRYLADKGGVSFEELYEVFNMGVGMVLVVAPEVAEKILIHINAQGVAAWNIGCIIEGEKKVQLV